MTGYTSVRKSIPLVILFGMVTALSPRLIAGSGQIATASTFQPGYDAEGAIKGDRFSVDPGSIWKGRAGESNWWWGIEFAEPRNIGSIVQIHGDHPFALRNAPKRYVWQASLDGRLWHDVDETRTDTERRLFRIHRLKQAQLVKFLRLQIDAVTGDFPAIREVEFHSRPNEAISFPDWVLVVNTTHDPTVPGHGKEFIPLAKSCPGWEKLEAQQVWLDSFDPAFVTMEPRPLCAFLSGNFKDWCQVDRELWRGAQEVLKSRSLPIWASCGGAQGLAILSETGVDKPWDCPHCRYPKNPKLPIYTHIGHTAERPCGDYSGCIFERGEHRVRQIGSDPVFEGLPEQFGVMESHCGQIEWPPSGWELIATAGEGTKTKVQCIRVQSANIYGAQFHIEMEGTAETSRKIMSNFLRLAKEGTRDGARHSDDIGRSTVQSRR